MPDVASTSQAVPNEALDLAVLTIIPDSAPADQKTADLVSELRSMAPAFEAANGFTYEVTGQTALAIDISDRLGAALPPFAVVVVGLCIVLLTIMFRSLAVPLSATVVADRVDQPTPECLDSSMTIQGGALRTYV